MQGGNSLFWCGSRACYSAGLVIFVSSCDRGLANLLSGVALSAEVVERGRAVRVSVPPTRTDVMLGSDVMDAGQGEKHFPGV